MINPVKFGEIPPSGKEKMLFEKNADRSGTLDKLRTDAHLMII